MTRPVWCNFTAVMIAAGMSSVMPVVKLPLGSWNNVRTIREQYFATTPPMAARRISGMAHGMVDM